MLPFIKPSFNKTAFNCPHCQAFSEQVWMNFYYGTSRYSNSNDELEELKISVCSHCSRYALWYKAEMIYPQFQGVEPPNSDLSEEIKKDYLEASNIVQKSPRGACAILRLAIQKLCIQLGQDGKDLNTNIAELVKEGLPRRVQEALDIVRVVGNGAVHPGILDLEDDYETSFQLFKLVNFIAEKMITEPKEVDKLFDGLPDSKKKQIEERDSE